MKYYSSKYVSVMILEILISVMIIQYLYKLSENPSKFTKLINFFS